MATLDKLGIDHDKPVKEWRDELSKQMYTGASEDINVSAYYV